MLCDVMLCYVMQYKTLVYHYYHIFGDRAPLRAPSREIGARLPIHNNTTTTTTNNNNDNNTYYHYYYYYYYYYY